MSSLEIRPAAVEDLTSLIRLNASMLDTWGSNIEAQRFFERQGFAPQRIVMWRQILLR
jgi:hypothetical protein